MKAIFHHCIFCGRNTIEPLQPILGVFATAKACADCHAAFIAQIKETTRIVVCDWKEKHVE